MAKPSVEIKFEASFPDQGDPLWPKFECAIRPGPRVSCDPQSERPKDATPNCVDAVEQDWKTRDRLIERLKRPLRRSFFRFHLRPNPPNLVCKMKLRRTSQCHA